MPPAHPPHHEKSLEEVVEAVGLYPIEAYEFVQQGLGYTVNKLHGDAAAPTAAAAPAKEAGAAGRHVTGRDLCLGLREYALMKWGLMARTVLARWNIRRTLDFGRIVFALVDNGWMAKTEDDTLEDFRDIYDFNKAFEADYRIEMKT
jgi:uncharacterized repeat protein (TIGR04138 family)